MDVHSFKSGTKCFDWTIPDEWKLQSATLKGPGGKKILDANENLLHIVNYSVPYRGQLSLRNLKPHLHYSKLMPRAIPYRTLYYTRDWGFCLPYSEYRLLSDGLYEADIRASFRKGNLHIGEAVVRGTTRREIILTAYYCHPLQANDGLSGVVMLAYLYHLLAKRKPKYTYRFFFLPETIGSLTLLASGRIDRRNVEYAMVATCVGTGPLVTYKKTFIGDHPLDRTVASALYQHFDGDKTKYRLKRYLPIGSDERQFSSPGIQIPTGSLMRSMYGEYKEYHTSRDDLSLVSHETIREMARIYLKVILAYEERRRLKVTVHGGEPFLTKHNLYSSVGGLKRRNHEMLRNWILHLADGRNTLQDIALRAKIPPSKLKPHLQELIKYGIVKALES